jgi:hypothetical protein
LADKLAKLERSHLPEKWQILARSWSHCQKS